MRISPGGRASQVRQFIVKRGGGAGAFVQGVEVELLVGAVDAVVAQAKADEERVDA